MLLDFNGDSVDPVVAFSRMTIFCNIYTIYPWVWEIFLSSGIIFFFLQRLKFFFLINTSCITFKLCFPSLHSPLSHPRPPFLLFFLFLHHSRPSQGYKRNTAQHVKIRVGTTLPPSSTSFSRSNCMPMIKFLLYKYFTCLVRAQYFWDYYEKYCFTDFFLSYYNLYIKNDTDFCVLILLSSWQYLSVVEIPGRVFRIFFIKVNNNNSNNKKQTHHIQDMPRFKLDRIPALRMGKGLKSPHLT